MARIKKATGDELYELRRSLHEEIETGGLPIPEAIRRMREICGFSQAVFAKKFGLTTRQVWQIEAGACNPTIATLNKIGQAFGFQVGFTLKSPKFVKNATDR